MKTPEKIIVIFGLLVCIGLAAAAWTYADGLWASERGRGDCAAAWSPCAITTALEIVQPGETIHILGTISTPFIVEKSGTAEAPISIQGGTVDALGSDAQSAVQVRGSWVVIDRVEIMHGYDFGIRVDGDHVVIKNSKIHDNVTNPLYRLPDGTCNNAQPGGWGAAHRHYIGADFGQLLDNEVYQNCGEGISALQANNLEIAGNIVYDNFSVGIYIDSSQNVVIRGNVTRATNPHYFRNGLPMRGISLGQEEYEWAGFVQIRNIVIEENLFDNVGGISFYYESPNAHLEYITVAGNTFQGVPAPQVFFPDLAGNAGIVVENNTIETGD